VPLAEAPKHGRVVSVKDLIVVCANCHRMLHRSPGFPSIDVIKRRVRESRNRRVRARKSTGERSWAAV
jgi:predicted HNH restriction endonuclease